MALPKGSGNRRLHAGRIAEALHTLNRARIRGLDNVQAFSLFCEGLGVDRISDMLRNIMKPRFIADTPAVARRHCIR